LILGLELSFTVNIVYGFLQRNSRRPAVELGIPHTPPCPSSRWA
jgi:hypothetical protein